MAKQHEFMAKEAGTMSNPYRWVNKGEIVILDDEQAKFYSKSKWLLPRKLVENQPIPPIMPFINVTGRTGTNGIEAMSQIVRPPVVDGYTSNIDKIIEHEKAQDAATADAQDAGETIGGESAIGTGNLDPIG